MVLKSMGLERKHISKILEHSLSLVYSFSCLVMATLFAKSNSAAQYKKINCINSWFHSFLKYQFRVNSFNVSPNF